ncbi:MAG TPA: four helix bundle protein [Bacteroidales bacterium]|nr:four helix bundle protein [Bacteroidales bacterium]
MNRDKKQYDLEERTAKFGEDIIEFCKTLQKNIINRPLIDQLVRAGTSIGANYSEANSASSKKDFRNKIYICKKESNETRYWLRMILKNNEDRKENIEALQKEAQEFILIFGKIVSTLKK